MVIGIIGAGHPFKFQYQALIDLGFKIIICDKDLNKVKDYKEKKVDDYKKLVGLVDTVLISTPPSTHKEIIEFFQDKNINIIAEKPLVTKLQDLKFLTNINNFYNILHFAYGLEISWFINNLSYLKIKKCEVYINDPYIINNHIRKESLSLHGSYLDETINPLSALMRILNIIPKNNGVEMSFLKGDIYDYKSTSKFSFNDILVDVYVSWNESDNKQKYIDIITDTEIIRLDSMEQSVINLTLNKVLFKGENNRMYNHYYYAFKDYLKRKNNINDAININKAILEYEV